MRRARKAYSAAQSGAAALDLRAVRARQLEALVGADEHDHCVSPELSRLLGRQPAPVDEPRLGNASAHVGIALDLHAGVRQLPRKLHVERHRQRIPGHEQRAQLARRRGAGAQLPGIERRRRHRRHSACHAFRAGGLEPTRLSHALVLEEGEGVVRPVVEREPVGHPACGLPDGERQLAGKPGLHLLARLADRRALEQDE